MAYVRKTETEYQIWGNYGAGLEEVAAYETRKEALADLKIYRTENPNVPYELRSKRVRLAMTTELT